MPSEASGADVLEYLSVAPIIVSWAQARAEALEGLWGSCPRADWLDRAVEEDEDLSALEEEERELHRTRYRRGQMYATRGATDVAHQALQKR